MPPGKDTHSFGSSGSEVETSAGTFALAGDVCYSYFSVESDVAPGYLQGNVWNLLHEMERVRKWPAPDLARMLPAMTSRFSNAIPLENPTTSVSPASSRRQPPEPDRIVLFQAPHLIQIRLSCDEWCAAPPRPAARFRILIPIDRASPRRSA